MKIAKNRNFLAKFKSFFQALKKRLPVLVLLPTARKPL